ncbi:hypothetical protein Tco_0058504 [Tanacetum coccineum]
MRDVCSLMRAWTSAGPSSSAANTACPQCDSSALLAISCLISSVTKDEGKDGVKIIIVNVIHPDYVDDVPVVKPNQHDDVPVVPEPVLEDEDEDPEEEEFEEEEEPQEEEDDMEVDIEEDENEPKLTYPYEEVDPLNLRRLLLMRSSVEQGTATMEKLVKRLGNAEDKVECKKLKTELEEARGFVFEERSTEAIDVPIMFEERPRTDSIESASDCIKDEKSLTSELRGSPHDA